MLDVNTSKRMNTEIKGANKNRQRITGIYFNRYIKGRDIPSLSPFSQFMQDIFRTCL